MPPIELLEQKKGVESNMEKETEQQSWLYNFNLITHPSMDQDQSLPSPQSPAAAASPVSTDPPPFDPSRMIGIIKRKALIKKLAAVYHAKCLAYCQELLELQKNADEPFVDGKTPVDARKEQMRPSKRTKKTR